MLAIIAQDGPGVGDLCALDVQDVLGRFQELAAPGWNRKPANSLNGKAARSRKASSAGRNSRRKAQQLRAQHHAKAILFDVPTHDVFAVQRQQCSPTARMRGRKPLNIGFLGLARAHTTPAAPSPKSAAATNMARLGSLGRAHRLHKSTVKNRTLAPGMPLGEARGAREARHPATTAKSEDRQALDRSAEGKRRFINFASGSVSQDPVIVLTMSMSISASARPASCTAFTATRSKSSKACR